MARLKLYTVHLRAWSAAPDREAVFVREGFSVAAFLFSAVWALYHRMWFAALLMAAAIAGLALAEEILDLDPVFAEAVGVALGLWIGFEANDWRRAALKRRGYLEAGLVAATAAEEAEHRFFERHALANSGAA
ncbi:MAG: DUF2628 domain-containing protein [Alphaproteobacteria bacterium]|nr:DUF2628 domain-containing protein [Alphaproteobacteria bacterium]